MIIIENIQYMYRPVRLLQDLTLDPGPNKIGRMQSRRIPGLLFFIRELNSPNQGGKRLFTWETQVARAKESGFDTGTGQMELCSKF